MDLSTRFRDLRERAGLTKTALAKPRYTVSYVSQIEAGRRTPSPEAMEFFADRLAVSPRYLSTGVPDQLEDSLRYRLEEARSALREGFGAEAELAVRDVLAETERYGLAHVRGTATVLLGEVLAVTGRFKDAVDSLEEALEGDLTERDAGMAVSRLARCYRTLGDYTYAKEIVERFLERPERAPLDPAVAAELQAVLISIYYERGDMTRAQQAADRAVEAAGHGVPLEVRANAFWDAARVLSESKRWDEALEFATRARVLMEEVDERRNVGRLLVNAAFICLEAEPPRLEEARRHLDTGQGMLEELGTASDIASIHSERGRLALLEGRFEDAVRFAERALEVLGPDEGGTARSLFLKGRALASLGRMVEAQEALSMAAKLFEKEGARQHQAASYRELGELHLAEGDVQMAVEALRAGLDALNPRRSRA